MEDSIVNHYDPASAPPYSHYAEFGALTANSGYVQADGRINVNLDSQVARSLAEIINLQQENLQNPPPNYSTIAPCAVPFPLNIVIQIVGSRGDVQPFIALGTALQRHGHRIRIATHDVFADFVLESGLEFYPIGGDPADLMAFMVKNPGLIPQMKALREGEVQKKRAMISTMLDGCWRSCIEDDIFTQEPFVADAIIANPPSFAHIHCAQVLGIPVHLMFTMPWSNTRAFPHPLANIHSTSMTSDIANWVSYGVVDWLTWQGLADVINRWRSSIDLDPVPATEGPSLIATLKVPFTYCWSPALIPKPRDWPAHIDVCGFFFRDPPTYNPSSDLEKFLESGPPPLYFGFGSIVVDNPQKLIDTIVVAVVRAGVRAIVSKGWSSIVGPSNENIYYIDDCPHEWLFPRVAAVVHHGGAGTTACGLLNGRPTAIVPFFGDQHFWGNMVAQADAGPRPIPYASLNVQKLAGAIQFCLRPETAAAAQNIARQMQTESGVVAAVDSFYHHLPVNRMRCEVMPDQAAVWQYTKGKRVLNLCKPAVETLLQHGKIDSKKLRCHEINPIIIENRRWDPLTGIVSVATTTGSNMLQSTGELLYSPYKEYTRSRSPNPRGSVISAEEIPPTSNDNNQNGLSTAGNMIGATLKGFGKFTSTYFKGVVVDLPHAVAEGFRQVPRLYGEKPRDYGPVRNWQAGAIVGGKNFVNGMADGLTGIITEPVRGAREEGALGAVKGFTKGTIGLATKVPSAGIGLVAYPLHGISKNIEWALRSKSRKTIVNARLRDGYGQTMRMQLSQEEQAKLIDIYDKF